MNVICRDMFLGFPTGFWHCSHAASCQWIIKNWTKDPALYSSSTGFLLGENSPFKIFLFDMYTCSYVVYKL